MSNIVQKILNQFGFQVKRYPDKDFRRRSKIVQNHNINLLLDVGANKGQYAKLMRSLRYRGQIISFEPLEDAFSILADASKNDKEWLINNYALGEKNQQSVINISDNSASSSILDILPEHTKNAPQSKFISKQTIEIKTLDSIFSNFHKPAANVMLKIDTQGYEKNVLEGALNSLDKIKLIQLEMALIPLYKSETLFHELLIFFKEKGFMLISLENGFSNVNTGQLLQVDGIFSNQNL